MRLTDPPVRAHPYPPTSPLARALNEVGDKWTLIVIRDLIEHGTPRYAVDLYNRVDGINHEQLRIVLARLTAAGLVQRTRYREIPPRVEYALTAKGAALAVALDALEEWADDWHVGPGAAQAASAALEAAGQTSMLDEQAAPA